MKKSGDKNTGTTPGTNILHKKNITRKIRPGVKKNSPTKTGINAIAPAGISPQTKTEREIALLMNNTEESFVLIDTGFKIVIFNTQYKKLYKKYFGKGVKKGDSILEHAQPERKKIVREIYRNVFAGQSAESQINIPLPDGQILTFSNKFKPATDGKGNIIGAFVTIIDITEKKRSEQSVIESEKRFRALVENGSDGIAILSAEGRVTYITPSVKKILGYTEEEIAAINLFSLLHPHDTDEVQKIFEKVLTSPGIPSAAHCSRVRHKNGTWRWLEATITNMLHDPSIRGIVDNFRDVTEKVTTEKTLTANEKRFKALVENGYDAVVILNAKGKAIYASPSIERVLGHTPEAALQTNMYYIVHHDHVKKVQEIHELSLANPGLPFLIQASKWMHLDGSWIWLEGTVTNMLHDPSVGGIVANFRNVTEKIIAENTLAANEKRFRALVENGNDAFVILNKTGTAIYASSSVERVLGYTEKETLSLNMFDILHANHITDIQKAMNECLANPGIAVAKPVAKWLHKDGTLRWLEGTITNMLHEPAIGGIVDNFRDVTEKVRVEEKIREERMLFRTLIENLPLNVYTKDLQSRKTLVNRIDYEYAGFTSEKDIIGKTDLELFSDESARNTIKEDKYIFTTGESIISKEEHHIRKDGSDCWFLISKIPLKNEDGKITGLLGISFDISERKETEEALIENKLSLQKAFDIAAIGSWKYDIKNDHYEWMQSALDVIGFRKDDVPDCWENYQKFIPAEDLPAYLREIDEAQYSGVFDLEHRLNVYGNIKWVRAKSHLQYDKNGKSVTSVGIIQDITKRKKAEEKLAKNEEQLSAATQIAKLGYWEEDLINNTGAWSDETYRILGFEPGEVLPFLKSFLSVIHPEDLEYVRKNIEEANKKFTPSSFTNRIVRRDGTTRILYTEGRFIFDKENKPIIVHGIHHDITEQKQAEEALKENKQSLQKAFDIAVIGSWKYDFKKDRFEWAQKAIDVVGFKENAIPYTWKDYLKFIPAEDLDQFLGDLKTADESGVFDKEHRLDVYGKIKWVRVKSHLEYDKKGSPVISTGIIQDITERKLIEQRLTDAYNFNQTIIETSPVGIWIYDESGQTISVNRAAAELSGANAEKLLTLNFKDIVSWKAAGLYDAATEALESGRSVKKEIHFFNTFNKELWFEALLTPVQFKGRKHLILMTYDIHDRMKAEKSLIQSEKQLSIAIQIARLGYWEFDVMEGLFTFNDQFYSMLKTTAEKAGGYRLPPRQYTEMFVHPDDQNIVGNEVANAITTTDPNFSGKVEHRVIFGDGTEGYISVNFYIVKDSNGQTIKTYGVNQDITERKRAEEEIKLAKERYELVARATNDAIYEWDIVNNFNYWGEGYETLFGHKRTSDKMSTDTWIENLHPDEKEKLLADNYAALENKTTSLTRELRFRCADGSYKTVFDKLIILYDKGQQPLKIVGAMQDITERKHHETAIQTLNNQLNKRAEELADSNAELERFAYIASHDLQEPLRMVGSFLQLLQKKYNARLDDAANQYIDFAVDGAERMKRLILDLLEYSRVGSNRDILSDINVGEEINNNVLGIFESKIKETNAVLTIHPMPVIKANKTQIAQLFQNLIGNALKYNSSPVPEIEIGCEEKNDAWEFYIKDNGIGVDKKFFNKIFIIFQRLHNRNQFSGTGVGLAICKKIIEKHDGTIWVESAIDVGTTFFFTIKK